MQDRHQKRTQRLSATGLVGVCLLAAGLALAPGLARAQVRATRALRSVDIETSDSGWSLQIQLEFPIRYLRHSPRVGRTLRIQVDPVRLAGGEILGLPLRESLPIPRDQASPLEGIFYVARSPGGPILELQFSQDMAFSVAQGENLRSLTVQVEFPVPQESASADDSDAAPDKGSLLLERARRSIRDDDLELAIALLTRVLELPEGQTTDQSRMDAQELIGLTYERQGRFAHARAEYEAYLERYADGPAADRVRQRLDALVTAGAAPKPALRTTRRPAGGAGTRPLVRDVFGSLAVRYFRSELLADESDGEFLATDVLFDGDIAGRLESEQWSLRGDFIGTYDIDVAGEGRSDDRRISRLSLEVNDLVHGIEAIFGRQSRSDSGILGRFDGLRVAVDIGSNFAVSALAGLPVESTSDSKPDTDVIVAGGAIDFQRFWLTGLEGQIFAIGQRAVSTTDRAAIGGELRYASDTSYSFAYLDYDVAFGSLNTFLVSSTWRPTVNADLRFLFERRNSPVLTLANALQGQPVSKLEDLNNLFSSSEIRDLAKDRTAETWTGSIGATQRLADRFQLSGDFQVNYLGGTSTSGGVEGTNSSGPDFGGSLQLLTEDWLVDGGVGNIGVRYFESESFQSLLLSADTRITFVRDLRVLTRVRWEWRDSDLQGSRSLLRPGLEIDWRLGDFLLNTEGGIEWEKPISGDGPSEEVTYFIEVGVRWEF